MITSRETIYSALFALVNTPQMLAPIGGLFNTIARNGLLWTDYAQADFPVLQMVEPDEQYTYNDAKMPRVELMPFFWIYMRADDPTIPPAPILNPLIDAVENAILPALQSAPYSAQNLGGLVQWVRIDGGPKKAPGYIDNVGMAILPIKILVPF